MTERLLLARRELVLGVASAFLAPSAVLAGPPGRMAFAVFRNGTKVGEHQMSFSGDDDARTVATDVALTVKVGPVPVYKYKHSAVEKWSNGKWVSVETTTNGNGKVYKASGRQMGGYVQIAGPKGAVRGPADAVPLSHWNQASFGKPLFNQQEGQLLKVTATKVKPGHWRIRGDAEIDDFYDAAGNWTGLTGKLEDGSKLEYKRI
ncbi:MAG: DUF6134 family protein [Pseudomonadota bacterium]